MESSHNRSGLDLKLARVGMGVLQYELAAAAGISPQRLSLIENGRLMVSPSYLARLFELLNSYAPGKGQTAPAHQAA